MTLPEFCIKRPVFTIVINILLIVLGLVGYSRLEIRSFPKISVPVASVSVAYPGASAEVVESEVTRVVEDALAGLEGLDSLKSKSRAGNVYVNVMFKAGYPIEEGVNQLRDKMAGIVGSLPKEALAPVISKSDSNEEASLYVTFTDTIRSKMALTEYVDTYIKPIVERTEGVGNVELWGARYYSVKIYPDPLRLSARGLTVQEVIEALRAENVSLPVGKLEGQWKDYPLVPKTRVDNVEALKQLVIRQGSESAPNARGTVRLEDVAEVAVEAFNDEVFIHSDGKPGLIMAITPQSGANPVTLSKHLIKYFEQTKETLPAGMALQVDYDQATFIKASIDNVYETLIEAVILVVLVVFGFLGSVRGTFIPITTIPICILAIFGFIHTMNYSINNMTLLALVLAIGLVVDDAIVMLENAHRHVERGLTAMKAAMTASGEIVFAIIAMTLTLVTVYLPIGLMEGATGSIFKEFAFTLAGTVLISGFVALTLTPMLCAHLLKPKSQESRYERRLSLTMEKLSHYYQQLLQCALRYRALVLGSIAVLAVGGGYLGTQLPQELVPTEDQGVVMAAVVAPSGVNTNYIQQQAEQIEALFAQTPFKKNYIFVGGVPTGNQAFAVLVLKDWQDRTLSQQQIMGTLAPQLINLPGVLAFPFQPPALPISSSDGLSFIIQLAGSYEELNQLAQTVKETIEKENPSLQGVRVDLDMNSPQLQVRVNRDAAADLGVRVQDIMETLGVLVSGRKVTDLEASAKSYEVRIQLPKAERGTVSQLGALTVKNAQGKMIPLASLIEVTQSVGAESLSHYNRLRSAKVTASLTAGYSQGDAVSYMQDLAKRVLGDQAQYSWGGQIKDFLNSSSEMSLTLLLALVFIYLVLAAQFESFRSPFIILLTVPFSIIGAVLMLSVTSGSNNLYTQIGFVTLIGLVTKHGILITEFANQLQAEGLAMTEAVIQAASTRLRPILMTTLAMVLGAVPLAFATGAGAYARQQLGWTIVGGMIVGTLFSLIVVPLAYTLVGPRVTQVNKEARHG